MQIRKACEATQEMNAYLWTECGDGQLEPVLYYRSYDGWLVCGDNPGTMFTRSYCVCSDTPIYTYNSKDEMLQHQEELRTNLARRREEWSRKRVA
jgi:hypothetical protein